MKSSLVFYVVVAMAAVTSSANADLIVNGDFETGNFAGWTTANLEWPYSRVTGWSDYLGNIHPHGGNYYASLSDDYTAGTIRGHGQVAEISQTVATTPGDTYTLSFWADVLTDRNYIKPPGLVFQAYWDNRRLLNIINPPVSPNGWVNYHYTLTGTGSDTITFFGANVPHYNGLDDVSLVDPPPDPTTAPLPGNLTMCGIAAVLGLGVCGYRWRRATWA